MAATAVTIRFYASLNDFLPRPRRGRRFAHPLRGPASVKDTIEALGVPHPEVDLVLVNGVPASLAMLISDADDVAVYPRFTRVPLDANVRVGIDPDEPVRFALDVHLQRLAALLRLAGFDAVVLDDDAALAKCGAGEGRVVLTRDVALLKRGVVRTGAWVRHTDPVHQLAEILERFDLTSRLAPFTRCTACNTPLVAASADEVADRLLPCTRAGFTDFRECPGCRRVYWQGSHYPHLLATLERAAALASHPQSARTTPA